MSKPVKVYTFDSGLVQDANVNHKDGFCVDFVRFSDYAILEKENKKLVELIERLTKTSQTLIKVLER